jgi:hypothetical protein
VKFENTLVSREHRYILGVDTDSGRHFAAIPVANQMVDYIEPYLITDEQYQEFLQDESKALEFVEACRRRERDHLLLMKPGSDRGTPV